MTGAGSRTRIRGDPLRCVRLLGKDTEPEELVRAVRAVVGGDALLSPGVTRGLVAEFAARSRSRPRPMPCPHRPAGSAR